MAVKVPVRTVFDSNDNAIGLSEFQSGETVGTAHGGTGLSSLGSAGQVLQVNSGGNGLEFGNKTSVNLDPYLQVANANVNFVTKATALTSNTTLVNLINDRLQVSNANVTFVTKAAAVTSNTGVINYINAQIGASNTNVRAYVDAQIGLSNTNIRQYVDASVGASNTSIRAFVDQTYVTKAVALSTNNTIVNLVNDRLQVANADVTFVTKAVALSSNTTLKNLIDDRMQVANVSTLVTNEVNALIDSAPGALNTLNELAAALGDDANFSTTITNSLATKASNTYVNAQIGLSNTNIRAYVDAEIGSSNTNVRQYVDASVGASNTSIRTFANQTFETKAVALASNNSLLNLINDRIQVANVASAIRPTVHTITSNTTIDATYHNDAVIVNSSDTVVLTIVASSGLTVGDTFKFYPVGTGDLQIDLNAADEFLGSSLSSTTISTFQNDAISTLQGLQLDNGSIRDVTSNGLNTKVELLFAGSGNFVLTK